MANPNPKIKWKPGQRANPHNIGVGRPKENPELRAAKKLNTLEFETAVHKLTSMSRSEFLKFVGSKARNIEPDPKATTLELMVAGQIMEATKGKTTPFQFLMDRVVGPVQQRVKVDMGPYADLAKMTDDEKAAEELILIARLASEPKL